VAPIRVNVLGQARAARAVDAHRQVEAEVLGVASGSKAHERHAGAQVAGVAGVTVAVVRALGIVAKGSAHENSGARRYAAQAPAAGNGLARLVHGSRRDAQPGVAIALRATELELARFAEHGLRRALSAVADGAGITQRSIAARLAHMSARQQARRRDTVFTPALLTDGTRITAAGCIGSGQRSTSAATVGRKAGPAFALPSEGAALAHGLGARR